MSSLTADTACADIFRITGNCVHLTHIDTVVNQNRTAGCTLNTDDTASKAVVGTLRGYITVVCAIDNVRITGCTNNTTKEYVLTERLVCGNGNRRMVNTTLDEVSLALFRAAYDTAGSNTINVVNIGNTVINRTAGHKANNGSRKFCTGNRTANHLDVLNHSGICDPTEQTIVDHGRGIVDINGNVKNVINSEVSTVIITGEGDGGLTVTDRFPSGTIQVDIRDLLEVDIFIVGCLIVYVLRNQRQFLGVGDQVRVSFGTCTAAKCLCNGAIPFLGKT